MLSRRAGFLGLIMKILADENMPLAQALFSQFGEVTLKHGRKITADDLIDVDVLMVRSITKVNADLLAKAQKLRFVGTATAGFDHVDTKLLAAKGIAFTNAQGCNAASVGEYVLSSLLFWCEKYNLNPKELSLGVIGAGCTGSEVIKRAQALGFTLKICDPLKQAQDPKRCASYVSYAEALNADVVTFHVPLERTGPYATYHMLDDKLLSDPAFKPRFIINASRGEVIDDFALLEALKRNPELHLIKDVWEGEPTINCQELIRYADIATPHIAGYAFEGKCRGTYMLYEKLAQMCTAQPVEFASLLKAADITEVYLTEPLSLDLIRRLVHLVFDVRRDDAAFRLGFKDGQGFDALRKNYKERRELWSLKVTGAQTKAEAELLKALGFSVV